MKIGFGVGGRGGNFCFRRQRFASVGLSKEEQAKILKEEKEQIEQQLKELEN